ncbi:MAG: VCBS repeat-containing protein [Candidatus Altiarchaeota archaeon]|nr:VCBS repeat-containing protein [Candidatus Altiarchaeota archaeon]
MKKQLFSLLIVYIFVFCASADEYLLPTCDSIMTNDLSNLVETYDLDDDGTQNILLGTKINGNLYNYVYRGADCSVDWSYLQGGWVYDTPGDVKSFSVADLQGDGVKKIVVNSAQSNLNKGSKPKEYVYVISKNAVIDWNFDKECGFSNSVSASDLDNSGIKNIVLGTSSGKVCVLADDTKNKNINPVMWSYITEYPVQYVTVTDVEGDGKDDVIALSSKYGAAKVYWFTNTGELVYSFELSQGVYQGANPWELLKVEDLDGGGIKSFIMGTSRGVSVWKNKQKSWEYNFNNQVSSVLVVDLDGDGKKEVLVGSAPEVVAFDLKGNKKWTWTSTEARTLYSMSADDIDGDGKKEVAVGAKGYIFVIDDDGSEKGNWKYRVEIQGGAKNYSERDASAVSVYMGNLDQDNDKEVVAAWNWEEDTIRGNQYSTTLRVYEINKNYVAPTIQAMTTTTAPSHQEINNAGDETPDKDDVEDDYAANEGSDDMGMQGYYGVEHEEEKSSGFCCLPMLPALLAGVCAIFSRALLKV